MGWTETIRPTAPATVAEGLLRSVRQFADRTAIVTAAGEHITYAQLGDNVATATRVLTELGIKPGDRVAIWLPNRPEWAYLQFACAVLGAIVVPVNLRFRAAEASYVLEKSGARVLFMQERFLTNDLAGRLCEIAGGASVGEATKALIAALPELEHIVLMEGPVPEGTCDYVSLASSAPGGRPLADLAAARRPHDPLWIFWTSGTTSHPKGAVLDQGAVENVWNWTSLVGYQPDDRVITSFPVFYIAGNFWCMVGPLLHGAACIMAQSFTGAEIIDLVRREKVTVLSGIPQMLKGWVDDPAFDRSAVESVRLGFFGGATTSHEDLRRVREGIGYEVLVQVYGMTELQGFAMSTRPGDPDEIVSETCGTPLPGFELRLVRPGTSDMVEPGEAGELLVKGRRLLRYHGMSDEEHRLFFDDEGWFHTGDLLRHRPDGRYQFVGRLRDLIKVGGENVSAAEIEAVIRTHPTVSEVAVVPMSDPERGEVPVAFVEPKPEATIDPGELQSWCRVRMAPFKVPRRIEATTADQWPRTPSGKIVKWKLLNSG